MDFDHIVQTKIDSWTFIRKGYHELFSQREIDALLRAEKAFVPAARIIVFLSFENKFASLGGLGAVSKHLPQWLCNGGERVMSLSPFYRRHHAVRDAFKAGLFNEVFKDLTFNLCDFNGVCSCYQDQTSEFPSYFIELDDHFTALSNPYDYNDESSLLRDSLAFSAAVPFVLHKLGYTRNVLLHANDWETTLCAITSKMAVISSLLNQARTICTLHNSFDSPLSKELQKQFFGRSLPGETVLQCSIPMLNGPITTVSIPFAHELRSDPLQKSFFADHLQHYFSMNPPVGIENGMFGRSTHPFSEDAVSKAKKGSYRELLEQKGNSRALFVQGLKETSDPCIVGKLTNISKTTPILFMSGRLDFMQKGFDVVLEAFKRLKRGSAKLFFCPSANSSTKGLPEFLYDIEEQCRGDLTIWPLHLPVQQYRQFLQGASFLVMPSLYEPFGAATEGYISGTPVIARGTGGLWIQVNPYDGVHVPAFYDYVLNFKNRTQGATGILFREDFPCERAQDLWKPLMNLKPQERMSSPLYAAIVDAAGKALQSAIEIHAQPRVYGEMIINGIDLLSAFSWEKSVRKYRRVYETTSYRGI